MNRKVDLPLVAALQTAPDASWGPLLDQLDDARAGYDPVSQTGSHPILTGECDTYRATSSGGTPALSAESDNGKEIPVAPTKPSPQQMRTYRATSSGGAPALSAETDGSGKDIPVAPDKPSPQEIRTYRSVSSGGSARLPDDGGKLL